MSRASRLQNASGMDVVEASDGSWGLLENKARIRRFADALFLEFYRSIIDGRMNATVTIFLAKSRHITVLLVP